MKKLISLLILMVIITVAVLPAAAQGQPVKIVKSTKPISAELRQAVQDALELQRPLDDVRFYAITSYKQTGPDSWRVSLAALDIQNETDGWNLTDDMLWGGSVDVWLDAKTKKLDAAKPYKEPFPSQQGKGKGNTKTILPAGGGAWVMLPYAVGTSAIFGTRGVHEVGSFGGYTAVDFVGGSTLGSNIMPPYVYASTSGENTWECDDGISKSVKIYNADKNIAFYYLHFTPATTFSSSYQAGGLIGTLQAGSFSGPAEGSCGWASQQATTYHLHYVFAPEGGYFQAENWILDTSAEKWSNGTTTVAVGQTMARSGVYTGGETTENGAPNEGATTVTNHTMWDYVIDAVYYVAVTVSRWLPPHQPSQIPLAIISGVGVALRIIWVLSTTWLNMELLMMVLSLILLLQSIKVLWGLILLVIRFATFLFKIFA